jgi:hypothetical protein
MQSRRIGFQTGSKDTNMPQMSWPSWRRTRTVTRAASEVKLMATGAGRCREARTGQPGTEQQGRLGARRRASSARDSRGAAWRGIAGARVFRASAPGWRGVDGREQDGRGCRWGRRHLSAGVAALGSLQAWGAVLARPRRRRACRHARLCGGFVARTVSVQAQRVQGRLDASA